jgi:membrane-associated phospholipid phosphatase
VPSLIKQFAVVAILLALSPHANAQSRAEPDAASATTSAEIVPPHAVERSKSIEPQPALPTTAGRARFHADPILDGGLIVLSLGFGGVLEAINSTGEIRPQQISPTFDRSKLLWIDRHSIPSTPSQSAGKLSSAGLGVAVAFALVDPVLSGFREGSVQTGLVDAALYAESMSITFALTNMVKLTVRRPRPGAYIEAERHRGDPTFANSSTDSALSFFSGHSSMTAAVGATAAYLAFARSPGRARPWITLGLATALSTFVSVERVRAGKHFPTDVMAGGLAGAGIGIIVPHLHRESDVEQRRVWIGMVRPLSDDTGETSMLGVSGVF